MKMDYQIAKKRPPNSNRTARSALRTRDIVWWIALTVTLLGIFVINPTSIVNFLYYLCIWSAFIFVFHRDQIGDFILAFLINAAFTSIFILVQVSVYPETFGTTSPLGAWTDDSYFYSLVADAIPPAMEIRDYYYLYSHPFAELIKFLSIFPIKHPMDVIFFQSGIAALLTTFVKVFTFQRTRDDALSNVAFVFAAICPFLMMNGGVILLRDTFSAALLIYSLTCISAKRWPLAVVAFALQLVVRPGTAAILLPLYFILYLPSIRSVSGRSAFLYVVGLPLLAVGAVWIGFQFLDMAQYQDQVDSVQITGRDIISELTNNPSANQILIFIQNMSFLPKFILSGAYIFLYPFLSPDSAFASSRFDLRSVLLSLVVPIQAFWLNAWFVAGAITRVRVSSQQTRIVAAVLVAFLLIGTYSLQTRHKTIIYPLYYFVVAVGFARAKPADRKIGYLASGALMAAQVVLIFR